MSTVSFHDALQPDVSPGSMQRLVSRPLLPRSDPVASKRVCFYKSGDPQFAGHRMVINSRTFKTFDALLDALSKKVPLSFGVRTITTPKGTHAVRTLDDLQDGASYLCSDQKKVKPLNLDQIHRTHVPWNTTRPVSAGRQARRALVRQLAKRGEGTTKTVKMPENRVVVRTPKRLTVYKNKDPSIKRVVVLQRRTVPNFETLLDYLSKVMLFPVLKLYTEDGRKVDSLSALTLCSGIVVAAGNEPFRMGNYHFQGPTKTMRSNISESLGPTETETLLEDIDKPEAPISRSRNFSLSSERYLVEQINKSLNGSLSEHNWQKTESMGTEGSQPIGEEENCDFMANVEKRRPPIMPTEDDIEKSFRVNEDGSMTVEMKVHLTIKQEEMIHWTTTLSRSSVNNQQRAVGISKAGMNSVDVTNDESFGPHSPNFKENKILTDKSVGFFEEERESYSKAVSQTSAKLKPTSRRIPTPGHRQQRKTPSISQNELQESTLGSYSYMERTAQGELTEGYCVVSRSSSSSTRNLSKPSKSESGGIKQKKSHSFRSSGVAEVLQLNNNGTMGVTEAVLHIYESQGTCDNYYANTQVDVENKLYCTKVLPHSRPGSTDSGPQSSSTECDVDLTRQSTSSNSRDGGRNEMLPLSSASSTTLKQIRDNPQILNHNGQEALEEFRSPELTENNILQAINEDCNDVRIIHNINTNTLKSKNSKQRTSSESSGNVRRIKGGIQESSKGLQTKSTSETLSHTESEKKTNSSAESAKHKNGKVQSKKTKTFEGTPTSSNVNLKRRSDKELKTKHKSIIDMSHKVDTNDFVTLGSTLKMNENRSPSHPAPIKKILPKQRSMKAMKSKGSLQNQKLSESVSLPVLRSSPSDVNQYVENWLQKIHPYSLPYDDVMEHTENTLKPIFQIGCESADCSKIKSKPEKDLVDEGPSLEHIAVERPVSRPPVQIRCEGEPLEAQRARGFCKSLPSVRVLTAEQDDPVRMHKSSENLAPPDPCPGAGLSLSTDVNTGLGEKPVLKQLCLSVQSITQASNQTLLEPTTKEKSRSLPDFSSQVASAFGSPTRAFLSFLSLMTLRDGKSILGKKNLQDSDSDALQVMQSLEKISKSKDEEELRASLTSLQSSSSSQLKQSWRDFQEKNAFGDSSSLSKRQSEQEFALVVDSGGEGDEQDEQGDFGIEQLMDELNMSGDLCKEISSLIEGEPQSQTNGNDGLTSKISGKEGENDDSSVNGSLEKAADMEMEKVYWEDNVGLDHKTTNNENIFVLKESQELQFIQSNSQNLETLKQDFLNEVCHKANPNQTHGENCLDLSKTETLETTAKNQIKNETEIVILGDTKQNHLESSQQNLTDTAGVDHSLANIEDRDLNKEEEATVLSNVSEPDVTEDKSKQKETNLAGDEHLDLSEREMTTTPDNLEDMDPNEKTESIQSIKEHSEQSDVSEPENTDDIFDKKSKSPDEGNQYKFFDGQEKMSESDINMTPDNLEKREAEKETDVIESFEEHFEQSEVSEHENTDDIFEKKSKSPDEGEQYEFSDGQDKMTERDINMTPDNLEKRQAEKETDVIESFEEHSEQSDVSEPENTDHITAKKFAKDEQLQFSEKQDNVSEIENNMTSDNLEERKDNVEKDNNQIIKEQSKQSDVSELLNSDDTSEEEVKYTDGDEQPEFSKEQDNVSERENMTPDNLEEREADEDTDSIQKSKEQFAQSNVSEPENIDDISEQNVKYPDGEEQPLFSDRQDNVSERDNMTPENMEEREVDKKTVHIQSIKENSEQSDVSEPENTDDISEQNMTYSVRDKEFVREGDYNKTPENIEETDSLGNFREHSEQSDSSEPEDLCLALETKNVEISDKETAKLNKEEKSHFSTVEMQEQDCFEGETDHSDFEDDGEKEENKCVFAECDVESQNFRHSLTHHCDSQSTHRVHNFKSDDDEIIPDVEDAIPEMSVCEDLDAHLNKSSPEGYHNDENSMESKCKTEYDKMQQSNDSFVEQRKSNDEFSEDPDAEANSNPEVQNLTAKTLSSSTGDSEHVCTLDKSNHADKNETSAELYNPENSMANSHNSAQHPLKCKDNINGVNGVKRESFSSKKTNSSEQKFENMGMEHGYHYLLHPTEISQELLDFINSALLSSTLAVKCDSNGTLRIEQDKCKIRDMFRAQQRSNDQYGKKRLPSPYTSDLSDYRPETSDNGEYQSQASMELSTESDEEEKRLCIFREVLKQSSVNQQNHETGSSSVKSAPSSSLNSNNSPAFEQKSDLPNPLHYNRPTSCHGNSHCVTVNGDVDSKEGVLIDKGRWLLKENHLIRKSPPVTMGIYGNEDTTSPDTGLDNMSEDVPYPNYVNQNVPLAAISSSEVEDLVKPPTPKCMYFNVPHSSDSDLLSDAQSLNGATGGRSSRKNKKLRVSPMGESLGKKNGSMSSFASVEFKLPDGKVHPQDGPVSVAVKANTSQSIDSRTMQEEESRVGLNLRCGQHCPIL